MEPGQCGAIASVAVAFAECRGPNAPALHGQHCCPVPGMPSWQNFGSHGAISRLNGLQVKQTKNTFNYCCCFLGRKPSQLQIPFNSRSDDAGVQVETCCKVAELFKTIQWVLFSLLPDSMSCWKTFSSHTYFGRRVPFTRGARSLAMNSYTVIQQHFNF